MSRVGRDKSCRVPAKAIDDVCGTSLCHVRSTPRSSDVSYIRYTEFELARFRSTACRDLLLVIRLDSVLLALDRYYMRDFLRKIFSFRLLLLLSFLKDQKNLLLYYEIIY